MINYLRAQLAHYRLAGLGLLLLGGLVSPPLVQAQKLARPKGTAGELSAARQATVNGITALSGLTLFDGSRVRTAEGGAATLNFGKRGRIQVGAATELTLRLGATELGGGLNAGRLLLSAPAGVAVAVTTPTGLIAADGREPTVLLIEAERDRARVVAQRGEARVTAGKETTRVAAGESLTLGTPARGGGGLGGSLVAVGAAGAGGTFGLLRAQPRIQAGAQAAAPAQVAAQPVVVANAPVAAGPTTVVRLVGAGINHSVGQITRQDRSPEVIFETSVTCRDLSSSFCRRVSTVTP